MSKYALVDIIGTTNTAGGSSRRLYRIVPLDTLEPYSHANINNASGQKANAQTIWLTADGSGIVPVPKGYTRVNGRLFFVSPSDWRALAKQAQPWTWDDFDKGGAE